MARQDQKGKRDKLAGKWLMLARDDCTRERVAREPREPYGRACFILVDFNDQVVRRGRFPNQAVHAQTTVVADYSILRQVEDLAHFSLSGRIGLLPPDPDLAVDEVLHRWRALAEPHRAYLDIPELRELWPWVVARGDVVAQVRHVLERTRNLVGAASPEYLDLLSENGSLFPPLLPFVREYPTPQRLRSEEFVQVPRSLNLALPRRGKSQVVDRLLRFAQAEDIPCLTTTGDPADHASRDQDQIPESHRENRDGNSGSQLNVWLA